MIAELIQYLLNPGSKFAQKMGYSKELIAIDARAKRQRRSWAAHQENCKSVIKKSCQTVKNKNAVMVIGAGLLLDIPLSHLSEQFKKVYLIDVVFSGATRKKCRSFKNVHLIEHDVNGFEHWLTQNTEKQITNLQTASLPENIQADLIISANIISQLHLAPIDYLEKHFHWDESQLTFISQSIIQAHLDMLLNRNSKVCLIGDALHLNYYKDQHTSTVSALPGIELPTPDQQWIWPIAPSGELSPNHRMEGLVYAYTDFTKATKRQKKPKSNISQQKYHKQVSSF